MTRSRLLVSHLRRLLLNPKPFSSSSSSSPIFSQHSPLSLRFSLNLTQHRFYSWQLKPNRSLYFSTYYKPSAAHLLLPTPPSYILQMGSLLTLTRGACLRCFSLQRQRQRHGTGQQLVGTFWSYHYQPMSPDSMVMLLIAANVAVFILWRIADLSFMKKNFVISLDDFKNCQFHTIITSAFSHIGPRHLIFDMLFLESFGRPIAHYFGPKFLLHLYLGGAFGGSIFFWVNHAFLDPYRGYGIRDVVGLGAGAATNAMLLLCLFLPKSSVYIRPAIPIPGVICGILLLAYDLLLTYKGIGKVSHAPYLGGAFVGILVCALTRRRMWQRL